jgi:hypothetical protein
VVFVENDELVAIESSQPFVGAQPKIAIRGLRNRANRILRKTLFLSPDGTRVLREALRSTESHARTGAKTDQNGQNN